MKGNCDICGQTSDDLVDCDNPHCENLVYSECRVESDNGYLCKRCEKKMRKVSTRWERKKKIRDTVLHPQNKQIYGIKNVEFVLHKFIIQ